ncbi:MAG: ATP-binding protein [Candidatus Electryoneaceae bacterium]|nr:ATP-binding protein [Candidatus Electryoneaceae bacterium]
MSISLETLKKSTPLPPRDLIYGVQGIGKSTLASQMDEPVFLAAEDGLSGLPGIQHWEIRSFQDAIDAITALHEEHPYKCAVLDTVSAFEAMLHRQLLENWGVDSIDKVGANGGGYFRWRTEALPLWQDVLDGLDSLRVNMGMRIILIGHSIDKEVKPPEADPYRKYTIDLLNDKASSLLYRWADVVGFCNYKISVTGTTRDKKGQVTKAGRAIGSGERVMYLSERPAFYAKNRFDLPNEIALTCQDYLEAFHQNIHQNLGENNNG